MKRPILREYLRKRKWVILKDDSDPVPIVVLSVDGTRSCRDLTIRPEKREGREHLELLLLMVPAVRLHL